MHLREEIDSSRTNGVAFLMIVGRVKALKPGSRDARNQPPCRSPSCDRWTSIWFSVISLLQDSRFLYRAPTSNTAIRCFQIYDATVSPNVQIRASLTLTRGIAARSARRQNFPSPTPLLTPAFTLFPFSLPSLVGGLPHRYGLPFSCRRFRLSSH